MNHRIRRSIIISTVFLSFSRLSSQSIPSWTTLPNAPVVSRHNDAFFVNADTGWIANGNGQIYRTVNGGVSWQLQFERGTAHFRSIGFLNEIVGWAGNVGAGEFGATDANVLYRTENSGQSWQAYSQFHGPAPAGICGMHVVNDSTICAAGRVRGPSFFIRTTDGGETWILRNEHLCRRIDRCLFHSS
jgi:photosystem II stability/assembly factor-like uncharacterized protein